MYDNAVAYADQWLSDVAANIALSSNILYISDAPYLRLLIKSADEDNQIPSTILNTVRSSLICTNSIIDDYYFQVLYFESSANASSFYNYLSTLSDDDEEENGYLSGVYGNAIYIGTEKALSTYWEIIELGSVPIYDNILYTVNGDGDYIAELMLEPSTELTFTKTVGEGENKRNVVGIGNNFLYIYKPSTNINITTISGLELFDSYPEDFKLTVWYKNQL
jgi:hypothetical protein